MPWSRSRGTGSWGRKIAAIASILETCRRLDTNVQTYLVAILPKLGEWPINRVGELTPTAWKAAQAAAESEHPAGLPAAGAFYPDGVPITDTVDWGLNAARTNSEPERLREWALNVIAENSRLGPDACGAVAELAEFVKNLHPWGDDPLALVYPRGSTPPVGCVRLSWGGGFGKHGLLIGPQRFQPPSDWITKPWVPGLYGRQSSCRMDGDTRRG